MTAARPLSPALERLADALTYLRQAPAPLITARVLLDALSTQNLGKWELIKATTPRRKATYMLVGTALRRDWPVGGWAFRKLIIRLTRHIQPKGRAYDDDNLARALKPYRDGVAEALAIDDGSERLTFVVDQVRDGQRGVTVELWVRP